MRWGRGRGKKHRTLSQKQASKSNERYPPSQKKKEDTLCTRAKKEPALEAGVRKVGAEKGGAIERKDEGVSRYFNKRQKQVQVKKVEGERGENFIRGKKKSPKNHQRSNKGEQD